MCLVAVPFVFASTAAASELIARKATNVKLEVRETGARRCCPTGLTGGRGTCSPRARSMPGRRSPAASKLLSRFAGRRPVLRSRDAALASNRRSRLWSPPARPALELGRAGVGALASELRRPAERYSDSSRAPSLPLERGGGRAHAQGRLVVQREVAARIRQADVQGKAGLRLRILEVRRAHRPVWPQHLYRHARFRLRAGLASREQLPHAQADGILLLRLHAAPGRVDRTRPRVPRDGHRARRDARRTCRRPDPGSFDPALDAASNEEQVRLGAGAGVCRPS